MFSVGGIVPTAKNYLSSILVASGLAVVGVAYGQDSKAISVCDVIKDPLRYNGKMVAVRGYLAQTDEGAWLAEDDCPEPLKAVSGFTYRNLIWLQSAESPLALHRVDFTLDEKALEQVFRQAERLNRGPKDRLRITYVGLLETWGNIRSCTFIGGDGKEHPGGFGHLGAAPAQLLVKTAKDPEVVPYRSEEPPEKRGSSQK